MKTWAIPENLIDKQFLTFNELKEFLRISAATLYRLVDQRKIAVFKVGNSLRFHVHDVLAYLKSQRIGQVR